MSSPEFTAEEVKNAVARLEQDNLMRLFAENWGHIRHIEHYRMWSVNIYAVVVAGLANILFSGTLGLYLNYAIAFLLLFTAFNLLLTLKIEAVIANFADANQRIVDELELSPIAPVRTRKAKLGNLIRFAWLFPAFYSAVLLATVAALLVGSRA